MKPAQCPFHRKRYIDGKPCYVCSLRIPRRLRGENCPYKAAVENMRELQVLTPELQTVRVAKQALDLAIAQVIDHARKPLKKYLKRMAAEMDKYTMIALVLKFAKTCEYQELFCNY